MSAAHVAIIGAGLIGQSWAIAFARGGCTVALHDRDGDVTAQAMKAIPASLDAMATLGLIQKGEPHTVYARIRAADRLEDALAGAVHLQENTPEDPRIKREVFAMLDAAADPEAVIASSSSALLPSDFVTGLAGAARCLVAHPLNPPHLIPAVELVPGPATTTETMARTRALMSAIGQSPIETTREIEGFIMNRLQGALLDEAFSLVDRGIATPGDIDTAMRDGLARRWAFMGPFETIDLNAPGGIADFMDRYGQAYAEIGRDRPSRPDWKSALQTRLSDHRRAALPTKDRADRIRWRDARLAHLARLLAEKDPE